jgi:hypothetical protein
LPIFGGYHAFVAAKLVVHLGNTGSVGANRRRRRQEATTPDECVLAEGRKSSPKEDEDVTPEFVSRSFMIIRSSMIIFGMVVGMSITTNAETVKVMDEASTDGSFTIAQTRGQDRRDTRQDCRQGEGAVGADKRHCKQQGRQK